MNSSKINYRTLKSKATLYIALYFIITGFSTIAVSQAPVVTVRFANPDFNCVTGQYCVDVEFLADTSDVEVFGMNVRFFYDDSVLELDSFTDFQGGYSPVSPDPPTVSTSPLGPALFNFVGPVDFVNGAIQLEDTSNSLILDTIVWTKLFQVCFTIDDPDPDVESFCPSLVWDMEANPANGGFLIGDDGVVITIVDPDPVGESTPAIENVVQFNWVYSGPGTPPFGEPVDQICIPLECLPVITCPVDITIQCSESSDTSNTGIATATDACDVGVAITFNDSIVAGACPNNFTILRTWITTQVCGLSDTCVQSITVIDTSGPRIICPSDTIVDCTSLTDTTTLGVATAIDACDTVAVITFSDLTILTETCTQEYTILRTWTATDSCGNSRTCLQTISVQDTTPPDIICPANLTLSCTDTIPTELATATDNCSDSITISFTDLICDNPVVGFTGAFDFSNWTIIIPVEGGSVTPVDDEVMLVSPDGTGCSGASTLFSITISSPGLVNFAWNYTTNDVDGPGFDPFGYNLNGTFFQLTDNGGADTQSGIASVAVAPGDIFAFEQSSADCILGAGATTVIDFLACIEEGDVCTQLIVRTHTAEDECGNESICVQTFFIQDTTPPTILCPSDITIECDESTSPDNTGLATATDDCQDTGITFSDSITPGLCAQEMIINRTWIADDSCGNISSCVQTITVQDNTPPAIACPADLTLECSDTIPASLATATDNCSDSILISYTDIVCDNPLQGFTGIFDFSNWIITIPPEGGNVTTMGDTEVRLLSPDGQSCSGASTLFSIVIPTSTQIVFDWTYTTLDQDGPNFDPFGYNLNGTFFQLTNDNGADSQSGTISVAVAAGDVFAFEQHSTDCILGFGATTVVEFFACIDQPGEVCTQLIIRTHTADDGCGNETNCVQTILIEDTTPPVLSCPLDVTIDCEISTLPASTGIATATDNCQDVGITSTDSIIPGSCANEFVLIRTWTADDSCGNVSTCVQVINVIDTIAPLINCPADTIVDCSTPTDTLTLGAATATDACDRLLDITFVSDTIPGECPQEFTITRTWTAVDDCANSSSCVQTISVQDTTPPTFNPICQLVFDFFTSDGSACPADANISLVVGQIIGESENWTVDGNTIPSLNGCLDDNCTNPDSLTARVDSIFVGGDSCDRIIIVFFTILDQCGNESVDQFVCQVNIHDDVAPAITCPGDVTIECDDSTAPDSTGFATATDDCQVNVIITPTDSIIPGICPNEYVIVRTWTADDGCGNDSICVQMITVEDNTAPLITCPANLTIECDDSTSPDSTGLATATDNCDATPTIISDDVTIATQGCPSEYIIIRTWTATDTCGNSSICTQTIFVQDTTGPTITCPVDVTIECTASTLPDSTGFATATDNCDPVPDITYSDVTIASQTCIQEYTITRTWTATDTCGNSSTCIQTITIDDSTPPSITCPGDVTIECTESTSAEVNGFASATDNCDPLPSITSADVTIAGECPQEYIINRTWTATDACGNSSTCLQVISVEDNTPPEIACPIDLTLSCSDTLPTDLATATDNCSDSIAISYSDLICDNPVTGFTGIYDFANWTVVIPPEGGSVTPMGDTEVMLVSPDGPSCSGASTLFSIVIPSSGQLVFDWNYLTSDSDGPNFDPFGYNLNGTFFQLTDDNGPDAQSGTVNVAVTAGDVFAFEQNSTDCILGSGATTVVEFFACVEEDAAVCTQLVIRTHTAVDECGNASSCVQTFFKQDTIAPLITCPSDVTIECDASTSPDSTGIATATDNCDASPEIISSDSIIASAGCPQEYVILRTWTATDTCGNSSTCVQLVTVEDNTPPLITCPSDVTIECTESTLPDSTGFATATDLCDPSPEVVYSDVTIASQVCIQEYTITRTWTATDSCGNSSTCVQTITIEDSTPPVISCPDTLRIDCTESSSPDNTGFATATDNCDPSPVVSFADVTFGGSCPQEFIILRTWTATDACGNSSTCDQLIAVEDNTPPVITCPEDLTIDCTDPLPTDLASATDDCSDSIALSYTDETCVNPVVGFTGIYDFSNWTTIIPPQGGSVTPMGDNEVMLISPEGLSICNGASALFSIVVPSTGEIIFDWNYSTNDIDGPALDPFGYNLNGTFFQLTDDGGPDAQSGTATVIVTAGDVFAFEQHSTDCIFGAGATTVVEFFACVDSTDGVCTQLVIRTHTAVDECGNEASCIQTIFVIDTVAPVITCPADITIECDASTSPDSTGLATATDICDVAPVITPSDSIVASLSCPQEYTIIRTWTASDACGNSSTCVQVVTVSDNTPPLITCPPDITIECDESTLPDSTGFASATDNCDPSPEVTFSDLTVGSQTCIQEYTITRTWVATDSCGNSSSCVQIITIDDSTPPAIECPADVTIECTESTSTEVNGFASATDNCDPLPSLSSDDVTIAGECPQEYTINRTWTATDACGNTSTCVQIISVEDNTPPVIACPSDLTLDCTDTIPTDLATATDNCSDSIAFTFTDLLCDNPIMGFTDLYDFSNWTIIIPAEGGSVTPVGDSEVMMVGPDGTNCNGASTLFSINIPSTGQIVFDWNYTTSDSDGPNFDPFGYNLNGTFIQLTNDNGPDSQSGTVSVAVTAGDVFAFEQNSSDCIFGAGATTVVEFFACIEEDADVCTQLIIRTHTATDECGNAANCVQTFFIIDSVPPSIVCPSDITIECTDSTLPANTGVATASDNCGVPVLTSSDVTIEGECANQYTITRTFVATDNCGNTSTCVQTILVDDQTPPSITCPDDLTISCTSEVPDADISDVTSTDNCDGSVTISHDGDVISNQVCANQFTITRTYSAIDDCGNSTTCVQIIIVNDIIPPTITCPPNLTVDFGESTLPADTGTPTSADNCGGTPTLDFTDVTIEGDCPEEFTISRTWTATDSCGNTATCTQEIFVDGPCVVDLALVKDLMPGQGPVEGGDNVTFVITVTNEGDVTISSVTIIDYIPIGFTLNDPDWTPGTEGSTGQSATIVLSIANGALGADGLIPGESVSVTITLQANLDIEPGLYINIAEINQIFDLAGTDVSDQDIDSDPDDDDTNDPDSEDDHDPAVICVLPEPVIVGDGFVCPEDIVTYSVLDYNPDFTYVWFLQNGGGVIIENTDSTITVEWQDEPGGPFVVGVTVIIAGGCQATDLQLVFIQGDEILACNDHINISIDEDCESVILSGMILEGELFGDDNYIVIIIDENGDTIPNATVTAEHVGHTFTVKVYSECSGYSCWGTISVEDKIPPQIICACPVGGVEISGFAGTLDVNSPTFTRPNTMLQGGSCTLGNPGVPYLEFPFYLDIAGGNQFDVVTFTAGSGDSFLALYQDSFDPDAPCQNLVAADDDAGPGFLSQIIATLEADRTYILVVTTFDNDGDDFGDFNVSILGNGNIFVVDPACQITCLEVQQLQAGIIPPSLQPEVIDNCGNPVVSIIDIETNFDNCAGGFVLVTWQATDIAGNTATCIQEFTIIPLTLDSLIFPPTYQGECGGSAHPNVTGWPQVNGVNLSDDAGLCNIFTGYWDKELIDCGGGRKIVRTWTVLDWCTIEIVEGVQIIKLSDTEPPVLTCPANITVGTDFWYCYANVSVPKPIAQDLCSDITTYSLTSTGGIIVQFGNNFVINGLILGTYTATWTVADECGNSSTCSFTITVIDNVVPVANCDQHTIVSLTNDGPFGITLVPATVFDDGSYDNCGPVTFRARRMDSCIDFDWTTEGACIDDTPGGVPPVNSRDRGTVHRPCVPFACCDVGAGPIMVELEVTDAAGNVNYCMVEVEVQDKISPFVECPPDIIVSCDFQFAAEEGTFVDGEGNNDGSLDEDPLSHVFGNMFDAFRHHESVRDDIIINDPGALPFITPQPHFWGIDGWADDNCEVNLQVRVRIINDCSGDELPANAPQGAVRLIERRFSASDGNEGIAPGTCTQRIWVVDFDPFYITDNTCNNANPNDGVIWPCDVLLTDCPEDLGDTGEPIVFDDNCSLIGVAFEDTRFDFVEGACFKILREWTVIDWCQYGPDGEGGFTGIWKYVQVIKVHPEEGPEFLDCPAGPVVLCIADEGVSLPDNNQAFIGESNPLASSCSAHLNLCRTVHETCSDFVRYDVKLYLFNSDEFILIKPFTNVPVDSNNNAELCFDTRESTIQSIRLNGIPYNSPWCGDYHRILWTIEDFCGTISTCEYLFRLEDCKQPSPVCINGLSTVVMPIGGEVTVWAKDFDASSFDDCTPADELLFSFSGDTYQPSFTYNCDNVPAFGVEITVNIWVADFGTDDNCNGQISWDERNKDFCTTTIVVTDNNDICPDGSESIIAGEIFTDLAKAIEKVKVTLSSPGYVFPPYVTGKEGTYEFKNVPMGPSYTITPERNDDHKNGVSTLDLVKIQKHLLGKEYFTSPYEYIAADANNSLSVSAIDIIEIRKLILGYYTEFPKNKSWRFVEKGFSMNPESPWPFSEFIQIPGLAVDSMMHNDFVGVKIGDVNNTAKANALQILQRNGRRVASIQTTLNGSLVSGEVVEVVLTFPEEVSGFQWTLETTGLEYAGVNSQDIQIDNSNIGLPGNNIVTMSWNTLSGERGRTEGEGGQTIRLSFIVTGDGNLSEMIRMTSSITNAEAYTPEGEILDLKLAFNNDTPEFALYQNEPNPWDGNTTIGFDLPQDGDVKLTIFDAVGKVARIIEGHGKAGYNSFIIKSEDVSTPGIMYYRLDSGEYSASKKMVMIR